MVASKLATVSSSQSRRSLTCTSVKRRPCRDHMSPFGAGAGVTRIATRAPASRSQSEQGVSRRYNMIPIVENYMKRYTSRGGRRDVRQRKPRDPPARGVARFAPAGSAVPCRMRSLDSIPARPEPPGLLYSRPQPFSRAATYGYGTSGPSGIRKSAAEVGSADALHQMFLRPFWRFADRQRGRRVQHVGRATGPRAVARVFLVRRFSAPASALGAIAFSVAGPVVPPATFQHVWSVAALPWMLWRQPAAGTFCGRHWSWRSSSPSRRWQASQ